EPGLLGDRVQPGPAAEADDGARGAWCVARGEIGEQGGGAPYRVRRVGDAERSPGVAPRAAERDVVAPRAQRPVHDPLQPRAVQRDERGGGRGGVAPSPFPVSPSPLLEVFHPPAVPPPPPPPPRRAEKQPPRPHPRPPHGLRPRPDRRPADPAA